MEVLATHQCPTLPSRGLFKNVYQCLVGGSHLDPREQILLNEFTVKQKSGINTTFHSTTLINLTFTTYSSLLKLTAMPRHLYQIALGVAVVNLTKSIAVLADVVTFVFAAERFSCRSFFCYRSHCSCSRRSRCSCRGCCREQSK